MDSITVFIMRYIVSDAYKNFWTVQLNAVERRETDSPKGKIGVIIKNIFKLTFGSSVFDAVVSLYKSCACKKKCHRMDHVPEPIGPTVEN